MRSHAELVVLCRSVADRMERSGIAGDILGTVTLLREAGMHMAQLAADLAASERRLLERRQEHAGEVLEAAAPELESPRKRPAKKSRPV